MAEINLTNYDRFLKLSTNPIGSAPDGNVYFDIALGRLQLIPVSTLATFIITDANNPDYTDGTTPIANPLEDNDGIKFEAIYAFENYARSVLSNTLRGQDRFTDADFKNAGAYKFVFDRRFDSTASEALIRGSGWKELDASNVIQRVFFGNRGLSNIEAISQPYYQLGQYGAPIDFAKQGQMNECVLVYDIAGSDNRNAVEYVSIRTYGKKMDRKSTAELGLTELDNYYGGFALDEDAHLTTNTTDMPFADVYTTQAGVWVGMELEELDTPTVINGFAGGASGTFTWILRNPNNASLDECVAYLDAIATVDDDINAHATNTTNGKAVDTWYSYNATGQIVTKSGTNVGGVYIENVPVADQQRIVFTQDNQTTVTYQFLVGVNINVGATAKADANAWYQVFSLASFNTASPITVQDSTGSDVVGLASASDLSNNIAFGFDYDADTLLGTAGTDKDVVVLCEGDGGATQAKTVFTLTRTSQISVVCAPTVENNV